MTGPLPWWNDMRGGPLAEAAHAFVQWRNAGQPERGAAAIRWLSDQLDGFAHDTDASPSDDARFVEGGGAFLGMVLVTELDGQHRKRGTEHRVLLGSFGSFNPFSAIDAALDADDPKETLADRLRAAESEQQGTGPTSLVVGAFAKALADSATPRTLRSRFDLEVVTSDGIEVDLRRIEEATRGQSTEALSAAATKMASMLPGNDPNSGHLIWHDAAELLMPRLVQQNFVDELKQHGRGVIAHRPLGHGVVITLQAVFQTRARYIREDETQRWSLKYGAQPFTQAIKNLAERSKNARFAAIDLEGGPLVMARTGDGLDSARVLLPRLRQVLRPDLGEDIVVTVPHRDTLIAGPNTTLGRALVRRHAGEQKARAPHAITDALFVLGESGLLPV